MSNRGIIMVNPKNAITIAAITRKIFGSKWKNITSVEILKVKNAKLTIIPRVIPIGFRCPPLVDEERMIGRSGQMQGAKIVVRPATKEKIRRTTMQIYLTTLLLGIDAAGKGG